MILNLRTSKASEQQWLWVVYCPSMRTAYTVYLPFLNAFWSPFFDSYSKITQTIDLIFLRSRFHPEDCFARLGTEKPFQKEKRDTRTGKKHRETLFSLSLNLLTYTWFPSSLTFGHAYKTGLAHAFTWTQPSSSSQGGDGFDRDWLWRPTITVQV